VNPYHYEDDGQGQNTYVVVDEFGQRQTSIGLTLEMARWIACRMNAEAVYN
jgi:hypothetical protein